MHAMNAMPRGCTDRALPTYQPTSYRFRFRPNPNPNPSWTARATQGYYRIGAVYLKKGNARAAVEAFTTGLATDPR
jgi:hypothetical protein